MRRAARSRGLGWLVALAIGCVPPQAGWDVSALLAERPDVARISGQRIGDLTPFPALDDQRVLLVACRFAADRPVFVAGLAASAHPDWLARAVAAVDDAVPGVTLTLEEGAGATDVGGPHIAIASVDDPSAERPQGLADTLTECDVTPDETRARDVRGVLTRAEIRIRRAPRDNGWRRAPLASEEWIGALIHELGHALGFAGHPAFGDSLVLLEEGRLRAFGRRVLAGEALPAPNLNALYALDPGQRLGQAEVTPAGREAIRRLTALVEERSARLGPAMGPFASSGDRAARLRWRWAGGLQLELRFPFWSEELHAGRPLTVRPGPLAAQMLAARR